MTPLMPRLLAVAVAAALLGAPDTGTAGPPHCPPGHAKKGWCSPGSQRHVAPRRVERVIREYHHYHLPPPPSGRHYVVVDGDVFLVLDATREVIEAFGAVERLLRR